jgi:hypothetical protein
MLGGNMAGKHHGGFRPSKAESTSTKSIVGRDRLIWRSECGRLGLYRRNGNGGRQITIEPAQYPGLWRVHYPDGSLSDALNATRAKDAALAFVLHFLNSKPQDSSAQQPGMLREANAVPTGISPPSTPAVYKGKSFIPLSKDTAGDSSRAAGRSMPA